MTIGNDIPSSDQSKDHNHEYSSVQRTGPETGAPIAKVLNTDAPIPYLPQQSSVAHSFSATPFSGRLIDLLLDTPESPTVREKIDYLPGELRPSESNHSVIQLPKLPQLAAKKTQRPRIPPLLQGLHQPPPLPPSDRLFPPITSDKNAFNNSSRERGSFDSRSRPNLSPVKSSNSSSASTVISNTFRGREENNLQQSQVASKNFESSETDGSYDTTSSKSKVQDDVPIKPGRRRRRWSEQETKDLLVGVSRYGIGSWKKILQSSDFNFHGRTAVDLKDRFRVCYPNETSKTSKTKAKKSVSEAQSELSPKAVHQPPDNGTHSHQSPSGDAPSPSEPEPVKKRKVSEPITVASKMAEVGISGPFVKRPRRPQCKFSAQDDVNLLKGFEKYGSVWRAIRNDADLGFQFRRPTDLRDRFRIKYPEKFAKSGHKVKAKHDKLVVERQVADKEQEQQAPLQKTPKSTPPQTAKRNSWFTSDAERLARPNESIPDTTFLSPTNPTSRSNDTTPYTFNPFPTMFDDYGSLEHDEFSNSPIILNRDILQWADANHTSTYNHISTHGISDTATKSNSSLDGNHFNTWAGIQGQSTDVSMTAYPLSTSRPSLPSDLHGHGRSTSGNLMSAVYNNTTMNSSSLTTGTMSAMTKNNMLNAPNLPTIVFPYVPAASARNTLHNLPTPADLLSGVEDDG
ncbi:hypothetical protein T440DRAFT_1826 [Plenodomus tracheiphilus IPT5]|uniref:Myb-like domain-containing protein n=1 Tax=Plenodomus tracheiphilus IPT5 TaxID=1408161 RepID=A0A6A7BPT8_9PLEO|nr:hypothetical protein T440DRAFT_1826 [Plenodomus tracheiphilus IPT5]